MPPRPRKIPMRTCVVCGGSYDKKRLVRIVREPDESIRPDPTGKQGGRGAYLCDRLECRNGPQAHRQINRALGSSLSPESLEEWFGKPIEPPSRKPQQKSAGPAPTQRPTSRDPGGAAAEPLTPDTGG